MSPVRPSEKNPAKLILDAELVLCDSDPEIVDAWRLQFAERPYARVESSNVLSDAILGSVDALVVPGNAFGFLDSGFELEVSEVLGLELQDQLRGAIRDQVQGELLVGQALIVRVTRPNARELAVVYAPQYRTPSPVAETIQPFLSARGATRALFADQEAGGAPIRSVAMPSIGTGKGGLHPLISARQMRYGFEMGARMRGGGAKNLTIQIRRERRLLAMPKAGLEDGDD